MSLFKFLSFIAIFSFLTSCATSKYDAPPFTDLDKILELKPGQTVKDVSETLKIKPYDVVYSHDKGKMVLIYNYRVKDRRMALPTKTAGQVVHSEAAQRQGDVWYNENYKELYLLFQNNELKSIYGEDVLSVGGQVETMEDHLSGGKEDLEFASGVYQERYNRKITELSEDKEAKKRRNVLIGGSALIVLLLISIFTN